MVAKLHYQSDMSQVDIAKKLGVSTATISRLLNKARAAGIVRIEVIELTSAEEITADLIQHLGLKTAAVVEPPPTNVLGALVTPLAGLLQQADLPAGAIIGIGWGRAVREVTLSGLPRLPGVLTVALNGGMQQAAAHFQINEFVRQAAEQMGGTPHFLHAPYISSTELRDAFLCDPSVQQIASLWDRLDVAIVGVGLTHAPNPSETTTATPDEQALSQAAGDVIRHYFTESGEILHWAGEDRMIAATPAQLRQTPLSIGVAATPEKAAGIIGAARSGMINALVTDVKTAQAILDRLLDS
ncbi:MULTISPECIES: sugar-binding transcriptional regulator [unclassified Brenneria]|uniref:sugar-binding transcriptional regulator n=1 Tax=unclassified Brenneria TaxID=2634434 RepID=UPI0018F0B69A|nr:MULTISPECIES: sugar-binding domain-containing protein [unclassified Brenneria]MBJ7220360.1 winged helix-turn-helix transcriptional regulator [Brenneria sp. L3-3C-1]MEE3641605.1 sugar-binding domain-containing protein [Brenneria sp. L3_3C_1]MEE3649764.1 sugar-binding domain-containing protein [Brenneria sp. HEZEL_4_2_4]NPC99723.1 winged helix-turn-helix transcriptional regulator [Brenneria sp. hezel4-2-4]